MENAVDAFLAPFYQGQQHQAQLAQAAAQNAIQQVNQQMQQQQFGLQQSEFENQKQQQQADNINTMLNTMQGYLSQGYSKEDAAKYVSPYAQKLGIDLNAVLGSLGASGQSPKYLADRQHQQAEIDLSRAKLKASVDKDTADRYDKLYQAGRQGGLSPMQAHIESLSTVLRDHAINNNQPQSPGGVQAPATPLGQPLPSPQTAPDSPMQSGQAPTTFGGSGAPASPQGFNPLQSMLGMLPPNSAPPPIGNPQAGGLPAPGNPQANGTAAPPPLVPNMPPSGIPPDYGVLPTVQSKLDSDKANRDATIAATNRDVKTLPLDLANKQADLKNKGLTAGKIAADTSWAISQRNIANELMPERKAQIIAQTGMYVTNQMVALSTLKLKQQSQAFDQQMQLNPTAAPGVRQQAVRTAVELDQQMKSLRTERSKTETQMSLYAHLLTQPAPIADGTKDGATAIEDYNTAKAFMGTWDAKTQRWSGPVSGTIAAIDDAMTQVKANQNLNSRYVNIGVQPTSDAGKSIPLATLKSVIPAGAPPASAYSQNKPLLGSKAAPAPASRTVVVNGKRITVKVTP